MASPDRVRFIPYWDVRNYYLTNTTLGLGISTITEKKQSIIIIPVVVFLAILWARSCTPSRVLTRLFGTKSQATVNDWADRISLKIRAITDATNYLPESYFFDPCPKPTTVRHSPAQKCSRLSQAPESLKARLPIIGLFCVSCKQVRETKTALMSSCSLC